MQAEDFDSNFLLSEFSRLCSEMWLTNFALINSCLEAPDCTYYCLLAKNSNSLWIFWEIYIYSNEIIRIDHSSHLLFITCMTRWVLIPCNLQTSEHELSSITMYVILRSQKPIDTHRSLRTRDGAGTVFPNKLTELSTRTVRYVPLVLGLTCKPTKRMLQIINHCELQSLGLRTF